MVIGVAANNVRETNIGDRPAQPLWANIPRPPALLRDDGARI
jgi:hypothetical protein